MWKCNEMDDDIVSLSVSLILSFTHSHMHRVVYKPLEMDNYPQM